MKDEILNEFDRNRNIYDKCSTTIKQLLTHLISEKKVKVLDITSRVKSKESLSEKIDLKQKYQNIKDITDICGFRIVTYLEKDVDAVADIIKNEFLLDMKNSKLEKTSSNPEVFGYKSLHFICQISDSRASLSEYKTFKDQKFEIQLRSILQHSWAEIEHDLGYKLTYTIPKHLRRRFSRVSSLLEWADEEFNFLENEIKQYRESIEEIANDYNSEIDREIMTYYISKDRDYIELNESIRQLIGAEFVRGGSGIPEVIDTEIYWLREFEILSLPNLKECLRKNKDKILEFAEKWISKTDMSPPSLWPTVGLFYINYILLMNSGYDIEKYFNKRSLNVIGIDGEIAIQRYMRIKEELS
ncbi:GTP pyrophosphokinase [Leptospira saintgironsiae]|uniref:RelA/SpoT domain-containing protein n=1 Tax=Leptospira saintgironsiae TaxID=2023183 RepID=A0A2M9Y7F9_9LEPT|nr:hypothetical protein [Leptospira saintgironsiae]PJZ47491.1 hypothetical protein CH362_18870 [Leptospira saintgironsiae]